MSPWKSLAVAALALVLGFTPLYATPTIILDSDFRSDVDDVGALALLHTICEALGFPLSGGIGCSLIHRHVHRHPLVSP